MVDLGELAEEIREMRHYSPDCIIKFSKDYIDARKRKRKISFRYSLLRESIFNGVNSMYDLLQEVSPENREELFRKLPLALSPTSLLLEEERAIRLANLQESYYSKGKDTEKTDQFEDFFVSYYNLDYMSIKHPPKSRKELLLELSKVMPRIKPNSHREDDNVRDMVCEFYYSLPERKRFNEAKRIEELLWDFRDISYDQSWGRKDWTRLQVEIYPIFKRLEKLLVNQGICDKNFIIADNHFKEVEKNLRLLEKKNQH